MTNDQIKLVDRMEKAETPTTQPAQPQQQAFPFTQAQVVQQGVIITTHLNPVSSFTQVLTLDMLKQILPAVKEALKNEQTILQTIQQVQRSKLH